MKRDKMAAMRDRLQVEHTRILFYIDETAAEIEAMSAGQIYSPTGAKVVNRLDALTTAEERLSEAIAILNAAEARAEVAAAIELRYFLHGIAGPEKSRPIGQ